MAKTPEQREKNRIYMNRAYAENPEKFRARSISWNRRHGVLAKPPRESAEIKLVKNRENVRRFRADNPDKAKEIGRKANTKIKLENPERIKKNARIANLRKRGLTIETYEEKLAAQGGGCLVCGAKPKPNRALAVDHCHTTGVTRGILCVNCNLAAGNLKDSPERADALAAYLRSYQCK